MAQPDRSTADAALPRQIAALRLAYRTELAGGTDRFFEPRRTRCPWCGSGSLQVRLRTVDLLQHKPGQFVLEGCQDCGHIFQNPRLTAAGLDFYYRDFYDRLGERRMGGVFRAQRAAYRSRARTVVPFNAAPEMWLDVGTGHGHFCETARKTFPRTAFHGLDIGTGVELAERHGRVDRGLRGSLPELAPRLVGQYDVVSMFHYLEHCTDPQRELLAAGQVLRDGGLLLVEVPDPRCRYGRLLGRWWIPWFQPQHLNLLPAANLRRRLGDLGFTVVREQHGEAHNPVDLVGACWLMLDAVAPRENLPWLATPPPGRLRRAVRVAMFAAATPVLLLAALLDRLVAPFAGRAGLSNGYRLLAVWTPPDGDAEPARFTGELARRARRPGRGRRGRS